MLIFLFNKCWYNVSYSIIGGLSNGKNHLASLDNLAIRRRVTQILLVLVFENLT